MQFEDECKPGFSYSTLKTVSGVIKVTSSWWLGSITSRCSENETGPGRQRKSSLRGDLLYMYRYILIWTLRSVPSVSILERFDCNGFDSKKSISGNLTYFLTFKATELKYHKIPKISPRAYIFQRPFLRGLCLEGPIFGGAYLRREICVSKLIGLAI